MGFPRDTVMNALQSSQGDEEVALVMILSADQSGGVQLQQQRPPQHAGPPPQVHPPAPAPPAHQAPPKPHKPGFFWGNNR